MPKIDSVTLSAKQMADLEESTRTEVEALQRQYKVNLAKLADEESALYTEWLEEKKKEEESNAAGQAAGGQGESIVLSREDGKDPCW